MEIRMARLSCFGDEPRPNRRKAARTAVSSTVTLRGPADERATVRLTDASPHGCAIAGEAPFLRTGRFIAVELAGGDTIQAIVRWARDNAAGLEFLRPVPAGCTAWQALINSPWGA